MVQQLRIPTSMPNKLLPEGLAISLAAAVVVERKATSSTLCSTLLELEVQAELEQESFRAKT